MERDILFREISAVVGNLESEFKSPASHEFSQNDIARYQDFIKPYVKTNRDANSLTDLLFYQKLHPELKGRKLKVTDKESLKTEWRNLYRQVVRPLLANAGQGGTAPVATGQSRWTGVFKSAARNKVDYLIDGESTFRSLADTMRTATREGHFIYILGWMIDIDFELIKGDPASSLLSILTRAAGSGVQVRILIWDNPTYHPNIERNVNRLNAEHQNIKAFVDTATYSTPATIKNIAETARRLKQLKTNIETVATIINPLLAVNLKLRFAAIINKIDKFLGIRSAGSQHDKVAVINGESGLSAFCGGIDFNPNRFRNYVDNKAVPSGYHDLQCKVENGSGAQAILQKFRLRWQNHPRTGPGAGGNLTEVKETPAVYQSGEPFRFAQAVGTYNTPPGIYGQQDRSLQHAYFKIVENSKEYIYIEDQYLVNLSVAGKLNAKIRERNFKKLIIVFQDPLATGDMLFPNRKRKEFKDALFKNTTTAEQQKVALLMLDSNRAQSKGYHPGLHSKLLIADDEIAIIGTANLNQRSFTHDSETSVVVFDDERTAAEKKFVKNLRIAIWKEYLSDDFFKPYASMVSNWEWFANIHSNQYLPSMLAPYRAANNDLDQEIMSAVNSNKVTIAAAVLGINPGLLRTTVIQSLAALVPLLWNQIIDPEV